MLNFCFHCQVKMTGDCWVSHYHSTHKSFPSGHGLPGRGEDEGVPEGELADGHLGHLQELSEEEAAAAGHQASGNQPFTSFTRLQIVQYCIIQKNSFVLFFVLPLIVTDCAISQLTKQHSMLILLRMTVHN